MRLLLITLLATTAPPPDIPRAALPYRNDLIREARTVWGLNAPIAVFAGQVEQESRWRPDVCSAVACGLAQFTKPTAAWISGAHAQLHDADVFNPVWALRALTIYDADLYKQVAPAKTECDRWALALSSYNGGYGNLSKDRRICDTKAGCDRARWWGHVELWSGRATGAFKENRGYPRAILLKRQGTYAPWGGTIKCSIAS